MAGKLYLCATPIGNLSDITLRCLEVLESVDLIAAEDTRHTLKLLNHFEITKPLTSYYEHNRKEKGYMLADEMLAGKNIALVSDAGTPAISDPGEDLVAICIEKGIDVVPVPGCVAAINALIGSGMPTGRFCFEGFLSVNKQSRREHLEAIKDETRTMIFYEAPHKLLATLKDFEKVFGGDRRISLCRELPKIHEEYVRLTVSEAIAKYEENPPKGEFVLVVSGAEEKIEDFSALSVSDHVLMYINEGLSEKDAMKAVAKDRGIKKSDIYAEYKLGKSE